MKTKIEMPDWMAPNRWPRDVLENSTMGLKVRQALPSAVGRQLFCFLEPYLFTPNGMMRVRTLLKDVFARHCIVHPVCVCWPLPLKQLRQFCSYSVHSLKRSSEDELGRFNYFYNVKTENCFNSANDATCRMTVFVPCYGRLAGVQDDGIGWLALLYIVVNEVVECRWLKGEMSVPSGGDIQATVNCQVVPV